MIFRVDVKRWLRGTGYGELLERETSKMCCLGFAMRQCGAAPEDICGAGEPHEASNIPPKAFGVLVANRHVNSAFSNAAMKVNDDQDITDAERMRRLRALAKIYGHRFIFSRSKKRNQ